MTSQQLEAFNKLWTEHWPKCRRQEKKKALQYWGKINPELYNDIYAAVDRQKKQPTWKKDDCAYIPYLWRWLRDERWNDEVALPEDRDVEILIEALTKFSSYSEELSAGIMSKFRKMCEKLKTNWPRINFMINKNPEYADEIRKAFLSADDADGSK